MIWYSRWFIHPATAISTKPNGSNTCSIVVHSLSRAWGLVPNYRQFKQFQFSVHTGSSCGFNTMEYFDLTGFPVAPHAPQPDPEDSISGRQFHPTKLNRGRCADRRSKMKIDQLQ